MKKTVFILMILTLVSKMVGFIVNIALAYYYGASYVTDAYMVSLSIPATIFGLIGMGISTVYIPMFNRVKKEKGISEATLFTNNVINLVLMLCTIIVIGVLTFTKPVVQVFAFGFEGETLDLAIVFTRISITGIYFTGLIYIFNAYLQIKDNYLLPTLFVLPLHLIVIISIVASVKVDISILSIGSVIGILIQTIILIGLAFKKGFKYKLILDLKDEYLKKMVSLTLPVIIGTSGTQISKLLDKTIASGITTGGISALSYAQRLDDFIRGIFVLSIATVLYPNISKMAAENNMVGLKKEVLQAIIGVSLFVIPASLGAMAFSEPIIQLLFGRGAFDSEAVSMTSYALFFYSIGMIGYGIRIILAKVFYSLQDTNTPMTNGFIAIIVNIILNFILSRYLGIGGLALATSISGILAMLLILISLRKKIGPLGLKKISISFIKMLSASLIMILIAKLSFIYLTANMFSQNISLIFCIVLALITYFVIVYLFKLEEVQVLVNALKKKSNKTSQII
jgi:putative peptidoglycan lipid II flippase